MDPKDAHPQEGLESAIRPPSLEDLLALCKGLNDAGVEYVVIGGLAVIAQGFTRATEDIDLLLKDSLENHKKLLEVLNKLPEGASKELSPEDISKYEVIRVADSFVIDLMTKACGENYTSDPLMLEAKVIEGVRIPFASAEFLLKLKQGIREKDVTDRNFLLHKISAKKT